MGVTLAVSTFPLKKSSFLRFSLMSFSTYAAMNVNKIDPPFWYTGMQNPELQLMVYGEGIGTRQYPSIIPASH